MHTIQETKERENGLAAAHQYDEEISLIAHRAFDKGETYPLVMALVQQIGFLVGSCDGYEELLEDVIEKIQFVVAEIQPVRDEFGIK